MCAAVWLSSITLAAAPPPPIKPRNRTVGNEVRRGYLVELAPSADASKVADAAGMVLVGSSRVKPSWYFMRPRMKMDRAQALSALRMIGDVKLAAAGSAVPRRRMVFAPNDPYFVDSGGGPGNPGQWYLVNPFAPGLDIGVAGAWNRDITGESVTIGIVDDCLETAHPDLVSNYSAPLSWDFGQGDDDPNPVHGDDQHGISVAGIAAGRGGNGIGITGAAPLASLAGLRVDFLNQTEQMFIDATLYRTDAIKVKNHSYSIPVPYIYDEAQVEAIRLAASQGVVNVHAAGNESENANSRSVQAERTALTVSALGSDGEIAYYSNFGACVFATAPSSSWSGLLRVTTTDRTGSGGYNDGTNPDFPDSDYTTDFGGTSAAAPIMAGVVAQICQVNPNLDIRGVKHILARTCRIVDPTDAEWVTNGAGYHFNPKYGFGLIDADAATVLAGSLASPPPEVSYPTGTVSVNRVIPDNNPTGITVTFDLIGDIPLETISLTVGLRHSYFGDIDIVLTSPAGTSSRLAYGQTPGSPSSPSYEWTFSSAAFWGENPTGTWTLRLADIWARDTGKWKTYSVTAYAGAPPPRDPNFQIAVEYSTDERRVRLTYGAETWNFVRPVAGSWDYAPSGRVLWVATDGRDANPGTQAQPFRTIRRGIDVSAAGDVVYIKAGTYYEKMLIAKGGTSTDPIVISCAPDALGDVWIMPPPLAYGFAGNDPNDPNDDTWASESAVIQFETAAARGVWINGLMIVGPRWFDQADQMRASAVARAPDCIRWTDGAGDGCRVTNCLVTNALRCGMAEIGQGGSNMLLEGNLIFRNGLDANYDHGSWLTANGHVHNGNVVFDNAGWGIHSLGPGRSIDPNDPNAGWIEDLPSNQWIGRNICFGHARGGGILLTGVGNQVYHNTCTDNLYGLKWHGAAENVTDAGNVARNNLLSLNTYNFPDNPDWDPNANSRDYNYESDTPMLVDRASGDFRIYGLSPCVNAGTDLSAQFAVASIPYIYYDPNKSGAAPDIGAIEYIPGDNNGDGKCSIDDYVTLIGNYNSAGGMADGDTNGDGQVNIDDYIDLIGNYGYELGAAGAGATGDSVALGVSVAVSGNTASASITGDTYGNTSYTYVWTASSATKTVYAYGGPIATFSIDEPGEYVVTVTVFGNVGGKATAVYRYMTVE